MTRPFRNSTAISSGLLDASGNPIPVKTVNVTLLPVIDRRALAPFPQDMEARLMGDDTIVIFHPKTELSVEMPLLDRKNIAQYAAKVREVIERQAMGETPEEQGYRVT
jgi:hypothetical protein